MKLGIAFALLLAGASATDGALAQPDDEDDSIDVTVEGERGGASARDPTASSTVVRRARLSRPGASASGVLSDVPGVQVTRTGSSADLSTASVRGATSAQTPVYLAGVRLNDDVTGTADLSAVPLWMLDRVEIFRGVAPVDADGGGAFGAIFFEPRLPRRSFAGAGAGAGSFGQRALWLRGASVARGSAALVALRHERADNDYQYVDDAGTTATTDDDRTVRRENADFSSRDTWAVGRSELGARASLTTVVSAFDREQGLTGLGVIPARSARGRARRLLAGGTARLPCGTKDECRLTLSTSLLSASSRVDDPLRELPVGAPWVHSRGTRVTQTAGARVVASEHATVGARVSQAFERLQVTRAGGSGLSARRGTTRASGHVVIAPRATTNVLIAAGVECHGTAGPTGSDACGVLAPTGRVGAIERVTPSLSLLANVGRGVRVPTLGELYGVSGAIAGNPALESETAVSADAGVRAAHASRPLSASLDVVAFARFADQLVAYRRSGLGVIRPYNVAEGRTLGVESSAFLDALHHLRLESAVTLLDPRDVTPESTLANDLLPYQSRLVTVTRLEGYHRDLPRPLSRAALGLTHRHRSSRFAEPAGLIVIAEEHVLDADCSLQLFDDHLTLRAAIENVLDQARFDAVGLPLPGRSVFVSAELDVW